MPADTDLDDLTAAMLPRVARLARHLCGPAAEDATQEAFREVTRAWPSFRGEAAPTTWAHRIAVRTIVRWSERQQRRQHHEPTASQLDLRLDDAVVADFAEQPFARLAAAERRERVHRAINLLSPPLRAALLLRAIDGMDYAGIAAALELPLGTVKSRLAAATVLLASRLQDLAKP